jgi:hypothetical protein
MKPVDEFWQWFVEHEDDLLHWERDRERIFDELHDELKKVHPNLSFEFGPPQAEREFIISAGGLQEAFPAVVALTQNAPLLPDWQIIAFRPRRETGGVIDMDGVRIDSKEMRFTLLNNGRTAGIYLFIPGYREDSATYKMIGYLFLDEALGEFDVETKLALIEMLPPEEVRSGARYPFTKLAVMFDDLVARLEGRSGKPS